MSSRASSWAKALRRAIRKAARVARPPPKLTISQWADENLRLSPEDSSESGQYRSSRAPFQRGIMDACSDPATETVVMMSSAQVGKTTIIKAIVGFHMDQDPAPILKLAPTLEMAETFSKDRLAPMCRDTPCLREKIASPRARDSGNTLLHKRFAGGHLTMAGANSPASLASRPIRIVLCDEVDRYPPSAGTEGDPVNLAFKRATTFWNRFKALFSTPTIKGLSRIEAAYAQTDQRRFFVPCPHCDAFQTLKWAQVKWEKGKPEQAHYVCEHCGSVITDAHKAAMLRRGEWRPTSEEGRPGMVGFHINELYSPWRKFGDVANDFVNAKGSPETLKTWVNTSLGETYDEDQGERPEWAQLKARAEPYEVATVPQGGLLLTAFVDVQEDRLAVKLKAWGRGEESWLVVWLELYGDTDYDGGRDLPEVYKQLDDLLGRGYPHASGAVLHVASCGIDSGFRTQAVYNYCRTRAPRVFPTKGSNTAGRPVLTRPSKQDVNHKGEVIAGGVQLWNIGTDAAKRQVYGRLKLTEPGPGRMHFPIGLEDEYYEQLCAEKLVTKHRHGVPYQEWHRTRPRNEALDCEVGAYHAALRAGMGRFKWERLEQALAPPPPETKAKSEPEKPAQSRLFNARRKAAGGRRGGFVTNY